MCTALAFCADSFYFGRTLDHIRSYGEQILVTPRRFALQFRAAPALTQHYAVIGMGCIAPDGQPLYFDAINEAGLAMAGLNFPQSACYRPAVPGRHNLTHFELIVWVLGQCATLAQARALLQQTTVTDTPLQPGLPTAPLHWLVADRTGALAAEPRPDGLRLHDDPAGVLTNEPPLDSQLWQLRQYGGLSAGQPSRCFDLPPVSLGVGAVGLPGDFSSPSRFVRAAFLCRTAARPAGEAAAVTQVFRLLDGVSLPRGCCRDEQGRFQTTLYSICASAARGAYYYTTEENRDVASVSLHSAGVDGRQLLACPLQRSPRFAPG